MNETAAKLPEYPVVMGIKGGDPSLGPQLMAEIRDVTRFTHKGAITAFAGVDPGVNKSGTYEQKAFQLPNGDPLLLEKPCFKSWITSSRQSRRMTLYMHLLIKSVRRESLITST